MQPGARTITPRGPFQVVGKFLSVMTNDAIPGGSQTHIAPARMARYGHLQTVEREAKLRRKPTVAVPSNHVGSDPLALVAGLLTSRPGIVFGDPA
jgi:hypothetical protein